MRMKKIFTLVCAAVLTFGMANAKLIFQESFDGVNGEVGVLSAGSTKSADFFDGNNYDETRWWTALDGTNINVVEGSLSYSGYQTGIGNKACLRYSGGDDIRSFASSAVTSGKVYLAAIIHVDSLKKNATPDYFLSLCDHANSYYLGRVYAKSIKDGNDWVGFKLGVAKANDGENYLRYTSEVFAPKKDMLVVIEYEFVAGEKNDIVRLYVNPSKETAACTLECVQDTVTGGGVKKGAGNQADAGIYGLFGAFLRQGSYTPKVFVDEIKVATDWADLWVEGSGEEEGDKDEVENIAALMEAPVMKGRIIKSQPVVTNVEGTGKDYCVTIQDESGAVIINDFSEMKFLAGVQVGDKLDKLAAMPVESEKFINGLPTAQLSAKATPEVVSHENEVEPFEVSLAEVAKYGPALVQLTGVEFTTTEKQFTATSFEIKQGEAEAKLVVPACDIIGEDIPAKADIKALVVKNVPEDVQIRISASADVTNREERHETGVEAIQDSEFKSRKAIIDGQIVIIKAGKIYNVLGAEL